MFRLLRALSPRYTLHKGMKRADMASRPRIPKSDPVRPNSPLGPRQTRHTRFAGAVRGGSWAQIPEDSYYKEIPHSPILWRFRTLPRRRCVFAPCVRMSRRNGDGVAPERRCRCAGTAMALRRNGDGVAPGRALRPLEPVSRVCLPRGERRAFAVSSAANNAPWCRSSPALSGRTPRLNAALPGRSPPKRSAALPSLQSSGWKRTLLFAIMRV